MSMVYLITALYKVNAITDRATKLLKVLLQLVRQLHRLLGAAPHVAHHGLF